MQQRSWREGLAVALVVVLCGLIVLCLVVLDKAKHAWMALLVYACLYVAIALVERRSSGRYGRPGPPGGES